MTTLQDFLLKLKKHLNILKEQEARYGGDIPLDLLSKIDDHEEAIALTQQAIEGGLSETDWKREMQSLLLADDILKLLEKFIPDLPLHEQHYRERLKIRYAEDAAYYIPLASETTETTSIQAEQQANVPRSVRRRRQRANAEYSEWVQAGQRLKRVKLNTLRDGIDKYPCVILLGDPGSGKTTALENLAFQFAGEPDKLPLPLRLSEFGPGLTLEKFIFQAWSGSSNAGHWGAPELSANLESYLEEGKLFILFDALNEMPREGYKQRAQELRQFIDQWAQKGNRFLVTCRVLDYGEELSGLQRVELQPLGEDQIKVFLQNELAGEWEALWQKLTESDNSQRRLLEMARNPYLLTMMIDIFAEDGRLGRNRAELMERFTQILLSWARAKCPPDDWLEADVQREVLAVVAYEMQARAGSGTVVETRHIKKIMPTQVQTDPNFPPDETPPDQALTLAASANIIEMPVDRSSVRFYHQLLQEYFAARHLLKQDPTSLTERWRWPWLETEMPLWVSPENKYDPLPPPPPTGWEETTILAAGLTAENDDQLVRALINVNPVLAGRCVYEGQARVDRNIRQAVIGSLLTTIARAEVALRVRIAAGEILGYLGDPRLGEMTTVPAGKFLMGDNEGAIDESPQHELYLPAYQFGIYPVTNSEYRKFVEADGYQVKRWWTEAGWKQKNDDNWTIPRCWQDRRFSKPNQPVAGISWFEAVAFCRWLSSETGQFYRLPTEAEWEKGSKGSSGLQYPWGNTFNASHLNTSEGERIVNATTPVGIYPTGVNIWGAFDCAGNVWDWCATKVRGTFLNPLFRSYPYNTTLDEWLDSYLEDKYLRALRGGSWLNNQDFARCAFRYWGDLPHEGTYSLGFRLVKFPD